MIRLILTLLLLAGCGGGGDSPVNSAQAQAPRPLIVVIGDSITAGYIPGDGARLRLAQDEAYTRELRALGPVITAAVGGATTQAAKVNQLQWLAPLAPDVVVILLGTNDAAQNADRAASLANVSAIAQAWPKARVVIVAPPRWDASLDPWLSAWSVELAGLAKSHRAQFVDAYAASAAGWQCSSEDFHPCEPAHRKMGRMVSDAAQRALVEL